MTKPLLDLSGKIDPVFIDVCACVAHCANKLHIPYLVVGAFARDLVLHYGYNAPIQRATTDIDFAIQVPSWNTFDAIKKELIANRFAKTKSVHRLIAPNEWPIDIVPFGSIADQSANIHWPPSGDIEMNVLGFEEALNNADIIRLSNKPTLDLPVASPVGMMLLKLIAWMDRDLHMRNKDAKDIAYLISTYETIPNISEQLYAEADRMEAYGWDITLASAHQLGIDAKKISSAQTSSEILKLLNNQTSKALLPKLINEMGENHQHNRNETLINAFNEGFKTYDE